MALTTDLKDELARVPVTTTSERRAEVAALLRFAGGLHIISPPLKSGPSPVQACRAEG